MNAAKMAVPCPPSPQRGAGWLDGGGLTFGAGGLGWEGALAAVVEVQDDTARVFVVLYEIAEMDQRALDQWDGATLGYYEKIKVRVRTREGEVLAWLYVLNGYEGGLPAARYVGVIADAAAQAGAPREYVPPLRAPPAPEGGPPTPPRAPGPPTLAPPP